MHFAAATSAQAAQRWIQTQGMQSTPYQTAASRSLEVKLACAKLVVAHLPIVCDLQANVRNYFMQFEEAQTQSLIDSKIMEFEMKSRQGLQVSTLQPGN